MRRSFYCGAMWQETKTISTSSQTLYCVINLLKIQGLKTKYLPSPENK